MTVKELKEKLTQFDDDKEVMMIDERGAFRDAEEIEYGIKLRDEKVLYVVVIS